MKYQFFCLTSLFGGGGAYAASPTAIPTKYTPTISSEPAAYHPTRLSMEEEEMLSTKRRLLLEETRAPSKSLSPSSSSAPSESSAPSISPSISSHPSISGKPSSHPSISQEPSSHPSISQEPSLSPSSSSAPSKSSGPSVRTEVPSVSSQPTVSSQPSEVCVDMDPNPFCFNPPLNSVVRVNTPTPRPTGWSKPTWSKPTWSKPTRTPTSWSKPTNKRTKKPGRQLQQSSSFWPSEFPFWTVTNNIDRNAEAGGLNWEVDRELPTGTEYTYFLSNPNYNGAKKERWTIAILRICGDFAGGTMTVDFSADVDGTKGQSFQILVAKSESELERAEPVIGGDITTATKNAQGTVVPTSLTVPLLPGPQYVGFKYLWKPPEVQPTTSGDVQIYCVTLPGPKSFPTFSPTSLPSLDPTRSPSSEPSGNPSNPPTGDPTTSPTVSPTISPTTSPTVSPTIAPTTSPTLDPTVRPVNFHIYSLFVSNEVY